MMTSYKTACCLFVCLFVCMQCEDLVVSLCRLNCLKVCVHSKTDRERPPVSVDQTSQGNQENQ